MANKYGKVRHSSYQSSVYTPVFSDVNKYLPQRETESVFSPLKRRYPKPVNSPSFHKLKNRNLSTGNTKTSSITKSTATSLTPSEHGSSLKVNVTREQRIASASSGEALYSTIGQDLKRPPLKRRHHSVVTPGFQDDVPVETKRVRRNYTTPAANVTNAARLLRFNPFNAEPPVFTLETVSCCLSYSVMYMYVP